MDIILSYVGSKKRFYPIIKDLIPTTTKAYIEPFAGGFSLGIELLENDIVHEGVLNDLDPNVYNFWLQVKKNPFDLLDAIDELFFPIKGLITLEDLARYNHKLHSYKDTPVKLAAQFYIQKKLSRGMTGKNLTEGRLNQIKESNNFGTSYFRVTDNILKVSSYLKNFDILNTSYINLAHYDAPNTFWYLDPPYLGATNQNYYDSCKTDDKETSVQREKSIKEFTTDLQGKFLISNFYSEETLEQYKDQTIQEIHVPSRMSLGYSHELLIGNFPFELNPMFFLNKQHNIEG